MNFTYKSNQKVLFSSLFQLCSTLSTGTLFIMTHDHRDNTNTTAQFVLKDGAVTDFSFKDNHGIEALDSFKDAVYLKSKFIKNYQFPLTNAAKIDCSDCLLSGLGFNEFLIDQSTQRRKQSFFKCVKPEFLENNMMNFA